MADGVLLVNLGTPAAPTVPAVRHYLAEFLSDPRVVELPRVLWLPILHGVVLRLRPARSARKYASIWTEEGSPLAVHTRRQCELLRALRPQWRVEYAMRYGTPRIPEALQRLSDCERVLVAPLYPQYSASTTESVRDVIGPGQPMLEQFHAHPAYIAALAAGVRRHWEAHGRAELLVMSFHGLPQRAVDRGDPYQTQCEATGRLLAQALQIEAPRWRVTYQSRFGAAKWLQPYTEPTLQQLAREGVRRVDIACPGFVADCLETLEEIAIEVRSAFLEAGGEQLNVIPCLNEDPEWIQALAAIAGEKLALRAGS